MHKLQLTMLPGEYWYGGHTNYGYLMPVNAKKVMLVDTTVVRSYGQANTLFVSNKGRVIWSEAGPQGDSARRRECTDPAGQSEHAGRPA